MLRLLDIKELLNNKDIEWLIPQSGQIPQFDNIQMRPQPQNPNDQFDRKVYINDN